MCECVCERAHECVCVWVGGLMGVLEGILRVLKI